MAPPSHEGDSPNSKRESQPSAQFPAPAYGSQSAAAAYYPRPMNYPPPGQFPYGGYPPPYAAQPPPPMYAGAVRSGGSACVRFLALFMLMLILWYFVLLMIASSNFDDEPFYTVDSFSVSNFSTSNSTLTCVWDTKINITNPRSNTNVTFTDFVIHVLYNDEELIQSGGNYLEVGERQIGQLEMIAAVNPGVQPQLSNSTVDSLAKDRENGWLRFSFVLTGKANYNYESALFAWTLRQKISAQCRDLRVQFGDNITGNATFIGGGFHARCLTALRY